MMPRGICMTFGPQKATEFALPSLEVVVFKVHLLPDGITHWCTAQWRYLLIGCVIKCAIALFFCIGFCRLPQIFWPVCPSYIHLLQLRLYHVFGVCLKGFLTPKNVTSLNHEYFTGKRKAESILPLNRFKSQIAVFRLAGMTNFAL